jgi:Transposase IS66 family
VWTFRADKLIAYVFSSSRSGETPRAVLGASTGTLVVDMYTGYNAVTSTGGRTRAACLAHVRRRFFDALPYAPEARTALEMIRDVYVVEHDAKAEGIARTDEHTKLRRGRERPIMDRLHAWLVERQDQHAPKRPMGSALRYAVKNWIELTRFLDDARIPAGQQPDAPSSLSSALVADEPTPPARRWSAANGRMVARRPLLAEPRPAPTFRSAPIAATPGRCSFRWSAPLARPPHRTPA